MIPSLVRGLLEVSLAGSWVYWLACVHAARWWRRQADSLPPAEGEPPGISILKPLHGADPEQLENFRSFCRQQYPRFQLVFGALDPEDPGLDAARRIALEFPEADVAVVEGGEPFGANRKVCNLANMLPAARYDLLALCDSDMRVDPTYLTRISAPFADSRVGLVTCPYRGFGAVGFASQLEALGIGADFIPGALLANRLFGMKFAFGSTIVIRRDVLDQIGGFESLADELADDYLLGARAAKAGWRVVLSGCVVDDVLGRESLREMWSRRLRWARTTRAMQPGPVFGSYVTHGTALALLTLAATGFAAPAWCALAFTLALRLATASYIAARCTRDPNLPRLAWLLPLSDLLSFGLWALSFLGSAVEWRGERFRVHPGGRLTRIG